MRETAERRDGMMEAMVETLERVVVGKMEAGKTGRVVVAVVVVGGTMENGEAKRIAKTRVGANPSLRMIPVIGGVSGGIAAESMTMKRLFSGKVGSQEDETVA